MATEPTTFWVNPYQEPIILRIQGKASFQNSNPVTVFIERMLSEGRKQFLIDFKDCTGMDSTFLGILAGLGLQLLKGEPKGSIILTRLSERNLELVKNLGLHRILIIDEGQGNEVDLNLEKAESLGSTTRQSEIENARLVLKAHESLVEADASNETKFQDVIAFLKNQIDES